jgi:elongation factor G
MIISTLKKQILECQIVPILFGSSFRNRGVQTLLDAITTFLPSPEDRPPISGTLIEKSEDIVIIYFIFT